MLRPSVFTASFVLIVVAVGVGAYRYTRTSATSYPVTAADIAGVVSQCGRHCTATPTPTATATTTNTPTVTPSPTPTRAPTPPSIIGNRAFVGSGPGTPASGTLIDTSNGSTVGTYPGTQAVLGTSCDGALAVVEIVTGGLTEEVVNTSTGAVLATTPFMGPQANNIAPRFPCPLKALSGGNPPPNRAVLLWDGTSTAGSGFQVQIYDLTSGRPIYTGLENNINGSSVTLNCANDALMFTAVPGHATVVSLADGHVIYSGPNAPPVPTC